MGVNILTQSKISTYIMLILAVFTYIQKKNIWKEHLSKYKYFYLTWIFSFIPVFGSGVTESRTIFFTELVAMIISNNLFTFAYLNKYGKQETLLLSIYGIKVSIATL